MQQPPECKRPSKGKEVCFIVSDSLWPHEPVAHQVPPSMGFSRQEYWSGLPFPSPGDLPNPGIKTESLASPALTDRFFTTKLCGKLQRGCRRHYRPKSQRQSWPKTTPRRAGNTLKDPRILHFCLPIFWGPCHLTVAKSSSQDTRSRQTRRQKATGTFLVTQWLRLCFHYRGRGTRAHMLQLRPEAAKFKKKERMKRQWSRLWERKDQQPPGTQKQVHNSQFEM